MNLRLLFFLSGVSLLASCHRDDTLPKTCSVENPVEDLAWLKAATQASAQGEMALYSYVLQGEFNGSTVFIFADCCPYCDSLFLVYDCSGTMLGSVYDKKIDAGILDTSTLVWKSPNSVCNF